MQPRKILVIKLRALGDTVLMTAALTELKKAYPGAQIHALVPEAWCSILKNHPAVDRSWSFPQVKTKLGKPVAAVALAFKLRFQGFDLAVALHASPTTALIARIVAPLRSVHFHGHKDVNRYSSFEVPGKGEVKPAIERDMDAVRALGVSVPQGKMPGLVLTPAEVARGVAYTQKKMLRHPVLVLGIGASRPAKRWPLEYMVELATKWRAKTGGGVLALGGPGEQELCEEFISVIRPPDKDAESGIVAECSLPIREACSVISVCALFAGNDSGLKHLAVALGVPTCTVFGPEDPYEWHPYSQDLHTSLFVKGLNCRKDAMPGMPEWCGVFECPLAEHRCMRAIRVDDVFEECIRISKK